MSIEDDHMDVTNVYTSIRHQFPNSDYHEIDNLLFKFSELYQYAEEHSETLENEMTTDIDDQLHEILEDLMDELQDLS